jgi:hypothetical protein
MARRLEKGRELLRQRLTQRGLALSAAAVASLIAQNATAAVPAALVQLTSRSACLFAAGGTGIDEGLCRATAVAEAVLRAGSRLGLKVLAGVVMLGVLGVAGAFGYRQVMKPVPIAADDAPRTAAPGTKEAANPRELAVQKKLDQELALPDGIPRHVIVKDALEFLADRTGLTFEFDKDAFEKFEISRSDERALDGLPKMSAVRTATILRLLLSQVSSEDGKGQGCFEVKDGKVIVTCKPPALEFKRPAASADLEKKLDQLVTLENGITAKTPLKEALASLTAKTDVTFYLPRMVVSRGSEPTFLQQVNLAENQPVELPAQQKVKLRVVLEKLLAPVKGEDGQVLSVVPTEQFVELVPVKSPQKK